MIQSSMIVKKIARFIPVLAFITIQVSLSEEFREFTGSNGAKIDATILKIENGAVDIKMRNGKQYTLPLSKFSAADQEYLKNWSSVGTSANQDWHQWRGPDRDGKSAETGLKDNWESPPELAWRSSGLGKGFSSLVILGERFFTLGNKGGQTHIICGKLEDGSEVWSTPFGSGGDPTCTPTVDPDSGFVYGLTNKGGGTLACVNSDGALVWQKNYENDFEGKMMSQWGYSESPLIDGDHLICTPGGDSALLAALNKGTGETIWSTKASDRSLGTAGKAGAGYGSVVISKGGGIKQYIQLTGRGLVSVAADDGRLLWNYNRIANGTANVPTPIISGDYVFGSSGYRDGGSALLKLSKSGSKGVSAREEYYKESKELQNHHGGMILVGEHLYLGHGHNNGFPACIELESGKTTWEISRGPGSGSAAITYADGHLYFRYENHVMALFKANPEQLELKGSFQIGSSNNKSWPHPVIHKGKLYLRDQDELLCYKISK